MGPWARGSQRVHACAARPPLPWPAQAVPSIRRSRPRRFTTPAICCGGMSQDLVGPDPTYTARRGPACTIYRYASHGPSQKDTSDKLRKLQRIITNSPSRCRSVVASPATTSANPTKGNQNSASSTIATNTRSRLRMTDRPALHLETDLPEAFETGAHAEDIFLFRGESHGG